MLKFCLSIAVLATGLISAAGISRSDDGNYVLENRFLRAVVSPMSGGRIVSLISKASGTEFSSGNWDMGIGGMINWQEGSLRKSQWFGKPFRAEVIAGKQESRLILERSGSGGVMSWITAGMSYVLAENSSALRVEYRISVDSNAMNDILFCLWLHNAAQVRGEKATLSLAAPEGVRRIGFDAAAPVNESFHYDAADGWFALERKGSPSGLVFAVPHRDLMCFYNWQGSTGNTMEIMFRSQKIPCGKSFDLPMEILLYNGLDTIDGAGNGVAGEFLRKDGAVSGVKIYAASDRNATVFFSSRKLPGTLETQFAARKVKLSAGTCASVSAAFVPSAPGSYEVICRVGDSDGKVLMTMKTPAGSAKKYLRNPDRERRGDASERFGKRLMNSAERRDCYSWDFSLPLAGDSKPWLKPYTEGRIKLLILTDMISGREAIELAGRMDADAATCTFSGGGWLNWHPLWAGGDGSAESNAFLEELLKKEYDAILLAGLQIDKIAPKNLKRIEELVRKGTGLVSIMPNSIPKQLAGMFPAVPQIAPVYQVREPRLTPSGAFTVNTPLLGCFPFNDLPGVTIFPYKAENPAISSGEKPFFSTGTFDKGRTALFSWLTGRPDNTKQGGISPFFPTAPAIAVQDYFYGMVVKALLWSAGREPGIAVTSFQCSEKTAELVVDNRSGASVEAVFELDGRHSGGSRFENRTIVRKLEKGINRVVLPLEFPFLAGVNLIDCRMKVNGFYADFAVGSFRAEKCSGIAGIEVPDRLFHEKMPLPVKLCLNGKADGLKLRLELRDRHGRLCARNEGTVSGSAANMMLVPERLYSRTGKIAVELYDGKLLLDRRETSVDLLPESFRLREWKNYRVMWSWPVRSTRTLPFHLRPDWNRALEEVGVDTVLGYGIPTWWGHDEEENLLACCGDFSLVAESIARFSGRCRFPYYKRPPFDYRWRGEDLKRAAAKYNETRDKKYLRRNPSLEDETFAAEFSGALKRYLPTLAKLHPALYDLGDEMSYGLFSNPVDFDFSESSLKHFRQWLRSRYSSIDELNAEWKRSYRNFDEVMPDTALEARERGVYAGWGMHRIYATKVFSDFLKLVADTIRTVDPGAKITFSGTQEPKPYNGYDWTLLMPIFDSISAYSSNGMPEVLRSFRKLPMMGWSGYGASRDELFRQIWNNAFNGHFGVGLYNEMAILNPDLTLTRHGREIRDIIAPLKRGVGALLFHSDRKKAEIAVHYSQASAVAAWIDQAEGDFSASRLAWISLIKSFGCNLRFVGTAEIENDILEKKAFQAFVLPCSIALSEGERAKINRFAEKGGIVLADVAPGRYSDRFVPKKSTLFPGMILAGKLPEDTSSAAMATLKKQFRAALEKRGALRASELLTPSNGAEMHRFDLCARGGEVIALWNCAPGTVAVKRVRRTHLYDVLSAKEVTDDSVSVAAGTPGVWVALPYRVEAVELDSGRDGNTLRVQARVKGSGSAVLRHVLRFEVFRDGKLFAPYSAVLEAPAGEAVLRFFPGIDEKSEFKVRVTDVISGRFAEVVL